MMRVLKQMPNVFDWFDNKIYDVLKRTTQTYFKVTNMKNQHHTT